MSEFMPSLKDGTLTFFLLQQYPTSTTRKQLLEYEQEWANNFPMRVNINKTVCEMAQKTRDAIRTKALGNQRTLGYKFTAQQRANVSRH